MKNAERIRHSEEFRGDSGNYMLTVRFDLTDGYLGIDQRDPADPKRGTDRILLSPAQVKALKRFVGGRK